MWDVFSREAEIDCEPFFVKQFLMINGFSLTIDWYNNVN